MQQWAQIGRFRESQLLIDNGCDLLVIDTAHKYSGKVLKALSH